MAYFLKPLTEETIALNRLFIPQEFVGQCGRLNLTNPVVLEPPVGDPVEVELYEDSRRLWLRNGWQELVDQYSLRHGHYLLFEYKTYSRFKLVILGANGVNLEFPEFAEAEEEKTVNTDSVEFIGSSLVKDMNNSKTNGAGGKQQTQLPRSGKRRTTEGGGKGKGKGIWEASRSNRGNRSPFERDEAESSHIPSMAGIPEPRRDIGSTSSRNPNFSITIKQYHMTARYMNVPTTFVSKHMVPENGIMPGSHTVMVFGEEASGPWNLSFVLKERTDNGRRRGLFFGGWSAFCRDNSLKPGDACRFELISIDQMKVNIWRG